MTKKNKLSIIYVYYNTPKELVKSVNSIEKAYKTSNYEVIVVDNNSPKKVPKLPKLRNLKVVKNSTNAGFGSGCNLGASKSSGEYLLFINPDTVFQENSIDLLLSIFEEEQKVGVVGPKMINSDGKTLPTTSTFITPLNALIKFSFLGRLFTKNVVKEGQTDVLSGACLILPRKIFEKVGGFDERFFMYFEEQDLCKRISDSGYRIYYLPKSEIIHHVGRSLQDKKRIKEYFQDSRFKYMKKHYGLLHAIWTENVLRLATLSSLGVVGLFLLSLWVNTYRMDELMLLIGDSARDFIEGYRMANGSYFPLVGIPSSVTWLHQGAISIWLIGLVFALFGSNPSLPGYFFGFIGAISTVLLFKLGSIYFGKRIGFLAAIVFATAPMIVVNSRMPYHTSIVPFFAIVFFFVLHYSIKNKKNLPLVFFMLGLLLQVELSNAIAIGIIGILIVYAKYKISRSVVVKATIGFLLGIIPFIVYDLLHGPAYILFPLWTLNRLRLALINFLNGSEGAVFSSPQVIYQQITSSIFPYAPNFILVIFIVSLVILAFNLKKKKDLPTLIVFLWIAIPLASFFLHGSPGTAYFSLIYPAIALVVAYGVQKIFYKNVFAFMFVGAVGVLNIIMLVRNDFYVTSYNGSHPMPPSRYFFGQTYKFSDKIASVIIDDANGESFELSGRGSLTMFGTSLDTYNFLILQKGGHLKENANLEYVIYVEPEMVKSNEKVIYKGVEGYVVKNN